MLHLAIGRGIDDELPKFGLRASDQQVIRRLPNQLATLQRVTIRRGDWHKAAPGFAFKIDAPATIYLAVDRRGKPKLGDEWKLTEMEIVWGENHRDVVYKRSFEAGLVEIPANTTEHTKGSFGMPHAAFVEPIANSVTIEAIRAASVSQPTRRLTEELNVGDGPASFRLEVDEQGNGQWELLDTVVMRDDYHLYEVPSDVEAEWIRITANQDCIATAYFHLTDATYPARSAETNMFAALAGVNTNDVVSALLYPAKKNRNLQLVTTNGKPLQFTKNGFEFVPDEPNDALAKLLEVEPEFTVDDASVILQVSGKRLRLPKGNVTFDKPFEAGWPRGSREVESERHLANFHGTFYEVPLIVNGAPPAWHQMRPVASHSKQIIDYCSWNGLLVLSGVRANAKPSDHVFVDEERQAGLWFGGVDDLWKLGKPKGQGGPWCDTSVAAGEPSDSYLMTGYDRKTLTLSADVDVHVTVEIDIDHQTGWHAYKTFELNANESRSYEFPASFSAHWLRFVANKDCQATAWLTYE